MELFSSFAFQLGVLGFLYTFLGNLIVIGFGALFRVRIEKFALHFDFLDKHLDKRKIRHTEYVLGWLPFGSYVKPLGMPQENEETVTVTAEDREYALSARPAVQQHIFRSAKYLTSAISFFLVLLFVNPDANYFSNLHAILTYTFKGYSSAFGILPKEEFAALTENAGRDFRLLPFTFLVVLSASAALLPLSAAGRALTKDKTRRIKRHLGTLLELVLVYLLVWKIPSFVFSFLTFENVLRYIFSVIAGYYLASFVAYAAIVSFARLKRAD